MGVATVLLGGVWSRSGSARSTVLFCSVPGRCYPPFRQPTRLRPTRSDRDLCTWSARHDGGLAVLERIAQKPLCAGSPSWNQRKRRWHLDRSSLLANLDFDHPHIRRFLDCARGVRTSHTLESTTMDYCGVRGGRFDHCEIYVTS